MLILNDLWLGNLSPMEQSFHPSSEYRKLSHKMIEYQDILLSELSEAGKSAFHAFMESNARVNSILEGDSFLTGFRMGALMMVDIFHPTSDKCP